jgi:hypothetical protein
MTERHWGDEELLSRLYGFGADDGHLEQCEQCRARWNDLKLGREKLLARQPQIPVEFLSAQRRAINARLERKPYWIRPPLAPSLTALLLILVILTVFRPAPEKEPQDTISDVQVFEDVFNTAAGTEPSAVEPVRSLFEVQQ